jgi:hypothetical protein
MPARLAGGLLAAPLVAGCATAEPTETRTELIPGVRPPRG